MGYGARALKALNSYYSGEYLNLDESMREEPVYPNAATFDPVSASSFDIPVLLLTNVLVGGPSGRYAFRAGSDSHAASSPAPI